jgi:uncharacterized iron-regulated membrane protein
MSDTRKSCLGFIFLIAAMGIAILSLVLGGVGSAVEAMGGSLFGLNLKSGAIIGSVAFAVSTLLAVYMFFQVRNLAWLPTIVAGVYAILPDILAGPADDIGALILGATLSGLLAWRQQRKTNAP